LGGQPGDEETKSDDDVDNQPPFDFFGFGKGRSRPTKPPATTATSFTTSTIGKILAYLEQWPPMFHNIPHSTSP
jgi:hypothetical protein